MDLTVEQIAAWEKFNEDTHESDEKYYEWIRELDIDQKWKDFLKSIVTKTVEVGRVVLNIGKILINLFREFARTFPATTLGILLGLFFGIVISFIPFIGGIIAALVTPLIVAVLGLIGFTIDCYNLLTGQTIIRNAIFSKMGQEDGSKFKEKFQGFFKTVMNGVNF